MAFLMTAAEALTEEINNIGNIVIIIMIISKE